MESSKFYCQISPANSISRYGYAWISREYKVKTAQSYINSRWWVLRHRLHHRFTDTESDPYSAEKGLFYSHVGWIFVKEQYPALKLVDKSDLDSDPVVRFQHRWFVPLALCGGLFLPAFIGKFWIGNWEEGLIWGGVIARIAIWHCTYVFFCSHF
jgi:stearoyl-CoA desaturase (Delta-9 desaturase)